MKTERRRYSQDSSISGYEGNNYWLKSCVLAAPQHTPTPTCAHAQGFVSVPSCILAPTGVPVTDVKQFNRL